MASHSAPHSQSHTAAPHPPGAKARRKAPAVSAIRSESATRWRIWLYCEAAMRSSMPSASRVGSELVRLLSVPVRDQGQTLGVMTLERESTSTQRLTERRTWFLFEASRQEGANEK